MRIFTEQALKEYAENHPDSRVALQEWTTIRKEASGLALPILRKCLTALIMQAINTMFSTSKVTTIVW